LDQFANDTPKNREEAFQETAAKLGISKAIVEKDFWVCWSLKHLFALPSFGTHMIFKGGTSLSKVYDIIHRFSEDVDLSLDRAQLGFDGTRDPEHPALSGKKQKQLLQELQDTATKVVSGPLLKETKIKFGAVLDQHFSLSVDPNDAQTLLFAYPSETSAASGYIQPVVRFEFGARGVHLPAESRRISPYVHQAFPDLLEASDVDVKVLGVERTFWEKATILHMLYHQDITKPLADRMSRHYYDMAQLIKHETHSRAIEQIDLLDQVAHHKSVFFKAAWANYENARPGSLRLLPNPELKAALRRDYVGMQEMIIGDPPLFDNILKTIGMFEAKLNG
jgi:hypothetical protein